MERLRGGVPLDRHACSRHVSDCVEMYQNGQDENAAFFWHQICRGSHRRDSQPPVITRDTKKTDKKAKFLSGCPRRKSPLFTLPVFMQFQVTADKKSGHVDQFYGGVPHGEGYCSRKATNLCVRGSKNSE